jgi:hypothetical protein
MDPNKTTPNDYAIFILIFQVIAWVIAINITFVDSPSLGGDPAGRAMAKGYGVVFLVFPCMIFIFISNFYLAFKKSLSKWHRCFSILNILGIIAMIVYVN